MSTAPAFQPWMKEPDDWRLPWLQAAWPRAASLRGHAVLLHGPAGVGQLELGVALAQAWLCEDETRHTAAGLMPPCGRCTACQLLPRQAHADLRVLMPEAVRLELAWGAGADEEGGDGEAAPASEGGRTPKASRDIRVADLRAAIDWAHRTSARGRAKVLLLHPAQRMNLTSANTLLKTLEEPPASMRIILCADDPQALLPTILSRCQRLALTLPPAADAARWLQQQGLADAGLMLAAAGGRPQEALDLARLGLDGAAWTALPRELRQGRAEGLQRLPLPVAIRTLHKLCLDLLSHSLGQAPRHFPAQSLPTGARSEALAAWARRLQSAARHADHPWNPGLMVESLVIEGAACWPATNPSRGERAARTTSALDR